MKVKLVKKEEFLISRILGSPWKNRKLTYRVTKYSDRQGPVNRKDVDLVISKAFATWSEQVDLSFTPTSKEQVRPFEPFRTSHLAPSPK